MAVFSVLLPVFWSGVSAADEYRFVYVTEWGATDVGTSMARWSVGEDEFAMTGEFAASGLARMVASFSGYVSIRSNLRGTDWQAEQLVIASNYRGRTTLAETIWSEDGQTATTIADPLPDEDEVFPVSDDMRQNVTDPFSAMMTVLRQLETGGTCRRTIQIYDGRRRAELSFTDLGTAQLEKDRAFSFAGDARVCGIVSTPLGGHRRDSEFTQTDPDPEDIKAFVAQLAPGLFVPVRIEVDLFLGKLTTRLDLEQSEF